MNFILDLILVLTYLIVVVICAYRGFVKSVWSTVTIIGSFVLAYMFGPVLGGWIGDTFVYDYVSGHIYETAESIVEEKSGEYDASGVFDAVHEDFDKLLDFCGIDIEELKSDISYPLTVSKDELFDMAEAIATPISKAVSNAIGIVVVFLCSLILISLIGLVMKLVVTIPIIRSINCILGAVLGLVEGLVILWAVCLIIGIFVAHGFMNAETSEMFGLIADGSRLLKFFRQLSLMDFINIRIE